MSLKVGVVGATGVVGQTFMDLMTKNALEAEEVRPFASERSEGKKLKALGKDWPVKVLSEGCFEGLDVVFFSSGDEISRAWAPKAVESGAFAIDNSAAFRMSEEHALVVPEINFDAIKSPDTPQIIANPNCSTIQLVVALHPLKECFGLKDVRVATYQAVSGSGAAGLSALEEEVKSGQPAKDSPYPHPIAYNALPHIGSFDKEGFCSEERKIVRESKKILEDSEMKIGAFTVRIPVANTHSEAVWVSFEREASKEQIEQAFKDAEGLTYVPHTEPADYPTAQNVSGKSEVFVGRLHAETDFENTWSFWCVGDNLLKGAALNGFQIAQKLFS